MLNTFPTLLSFGIFVPTILRIFAGFFFFRFGLLKLTKDKTKKLIFFEQIKLKPPLVFLWITSVIEMSVGIMIFVGIFTQIASIIAALIMLFSIFIKMKNSQALPNSLDFYILFLIVFIYFIFSGAGLFAFDLPL